MIRLLRYLPVIIPLVRKVLRNPKVRARLGLRPLDGGTGSGRR